MRGENDYRIYSSQHINELKFIKYAKSVGFELSKIKLAIPHIQSPQPNCPLLQQAVKEQLSAIDAKIDELQEAKTTLQKWITPHD
jgi:DNA-binding transcriptional MerR regulator